MLKTILNMNSLPEPLSRCFRSVRVRVREENGKVILVPKMLFSPRGIFIFRHFKKFSTGV